MVQRPYDAFRSLQSGLFPRFNELQSIAADAISEHVRRLAEAGEIASVVDLGCGGGEVLASLATRTTLPLLIGIDDEPAQAELARQACSAAGDRVRIVCDDMDSYLSKQDALESTWSKTLVLCLGHTLPHCLDWPKLREHLRRLRPRFVIAEFHKEWNEALLALNQPGAVHRSLRWFKNSPVHAVFLTTKTRDDITVERGIEELKDGVLSGRFWTTQLKKASTEFAQEIEDIGYIPEAGLCFEHPSGFGEMQTMAFSTLARSSETLNSEFYDTLAAQMPSIFNEDAVKGAVAPYETWAVAAILPFDSRHVLARYVSIDNRIPAPESSLLLAEPDKLQSSYPIADGLYATLLSACSAPTAVPLSLREGEGSALDKAFGKPETQFLSLHGRRESPANVKGANLGRTQEFFIAPVFVGTWPLICLVVSFPASFPDHATDPDVYGAVLRNTTRIVKGACEAAISEGRLVRPFVQNAFRLLSQSEGMEEARTTMCKAVPCEREAVRRDQWKSWLLTMPRWSVSGLATSVREDWWMSEIVRAAVSDVMNDPLTVIADWFRAGRFFEDEGGVVERGGHDVWVEAIHRPRLHKMLSLAGVRDAAGLTTSPSYSLLLHTPEWLWTVRRIEELEDLQSIQTTFSQLKAVYCRDRENRSSRFRHSPQRVRLLAAMFFGDCVEMRAGCPDLPSTHPSVDGVDPVDHLVTFFRELKDVSTVTLDWADTPDGNGAQGTLDYALAVRFQAGLCIARRGGTFNRLADAARAFSGDSDQFEKLVGRYSELVFRWTMNVIARDDMRQASRCQWSVGAIDAVPAGE